jgi:hypothetical protein
LASSSAIRCSICSRCSGSVTWRSSSHRVIEAPTRQIAENSAVDGGVVIARMLESKGNYGFDAGRKEYVDLVEAGIIDPTKVVRVALENAVSVASILLLTERRFPTRRRSGYSQIWPPEWHVIMTNVHTDSARRSREAAATSGRALMQRPSRQAGRASVSYGRGSRSRSPPPQYTA